MRVRWSVTIAASVAVFGGCSWRLEAAVSKIDTGAAVGLAAAPFTLAPTVLDVWAERAERTRAKGEDGFSVSVSVAGFAIWACNRPNAGR